MRAILVDGSRADDHTGERVCAALTAQLEAQGWEVEHIALLEKKIGNCAGDFFCWVRTPGVCNINDDNRIIAEALVNSDLIVYLTPVTFGGYSSALKRMVDHQIQNVSPFFARIEGETHHHKRYKVNPDLLAVGWMDAPDAQSEAVFRHLVWRNAINYHAKTWVSDVVLASQSDGEIQASAQDWLDDVQNGRSSQRVELPTYSVTGSGASEIRRALLLVGSPRTRKSASNSLGGYLFEQLSARSIQTETIYLHTVLRSPARVRALFGAVDAAHLVVLAFPLYVDSLPAPVIEALERIAAHRQACDASQRQLFAAIANCGFPEAHHCAAALAICEIFARRSGFAWAGALALGAGGMISGTPLGEGGGKTLLIRESLELAAERLALGQGIPPAARDMMAKPVIPPWAYRLLGGLGWLRGAKHYGAIRLLNRKPYLAEAQ
jgi:multimeric flavodoxin WrbA